MSRGLVGINAEELRHHAHDVIGNAEVVLHVKALGPGHGESRLEHAVLAVHDHFGEGQHVLHVVQEVKAADDLVVVADHLSRHLHGVLRLRLVAEHVGGTHEELLQGLGREAVPFLRFREGIGHIGEHGHMEMGAAAILDGEVAGVVEIRANEPVLARTHAVARVGLGDVARRRVGEMHPVGVADVVEERFPVAVRIRILLPALFIADDGQVRPEGAEARRFPGAVLAEGHVGVVALGRDFGHEAAQALALRCQILILHELGMLGPRNSWRSRRCGSQDS